MYDEQKIISDILRQLIEFKGKEFVLQHKENIDISIQRNTHGATVKILLFSESDPQDLFDSDGNLWIDETEKPQVLYTFQCNAETGECTLID